jgi:chemotaxis receptor (MCP) glutamine deamidase CheD
MNECRLAREGQRLVARSVFADVVVTMQVPSLEFAAMLRLSVPDEASVSSLRMRALTEFADQALTLLLESMRSMNIPAEAIRVSAIGGADVEGSRQGCGGPLALAIEKSLLQHGVILNGTDVGGTQRRSIWLESASGRLIVRSIAQALPPANRLVADLQTASASKWQVRELIDATA